MSQGNLPRKVLGLLKQKETNLKGAIDVNQHIPVGSHRRCMGLDPESAESRRGEILSLDKEHLINIGALFHYTEFQTLARTQETMIIYY